MGEAGARRPSTRRSPTARCRSRRSARATSTSATSAPARCGCPPSGKAKVVAINTLALRRPRHRPARHHLDRRTSRARRSACPRAPPATWCSTWRCRRPGMTEKDIEKVPMDPSTVVSAFVSGQIDGAGPLVPADRQHQGEGAEAGRGRQHRGLRGPLVPDRLRGARQGATRSSTSKVVKVLQEANDWRAAHPDEADRRGRRAAEDRPRPRSRPTRPTCETLTTADLVAKTEDGTVDGGWTGSATSSSAPGQLKSGPGPGGTYYAGDLYTKAYKK